MKKTATKIKNVFKWGDLIVLAVLLVATALSLWIAIRPSHGQVVEIYENGILRYSVPLAENKEIFLDEHGHNTIKIENGKVFMKEADCAGQDCVQAQPLSAHGGMIVCLPNKVVVRIVSEDIDAIT